MKSVSGFDNCQLVGGVFSVDLAVAVAAFRMLMTSG